MAQKVIKLQKPKPAYISKRYKGMQTGRKKGGEGLRGTEEVGIASGFTGAI